MFYFKLFIDKNRLILILGVPSVMTGILYLIHWLLLYSKHHGHHARR